MNTGQTISNTLKPKENVHNHADDIVKYIFMNQNAFTLIIIASNFVALDPWWLWSGYFLNNDLG